MLNRRTNMASVAQLSYTAKKQGNWQKKKNMAENPTEQVMGSSERDAEEN